MAPVSTTEKSPPKSAYDEAVQIKIGPASAAKIFTIHKGILIFYSGYFGGALRHSSTFREARDGVFWLPDEDIATWERFVVFLYREEVNLTGTPLPRLDVLCRLWVLADRREVPLLMNKCIDAIKDEVFAKWHRPVYLLPYIYTNTAPGSALRRLVLLLVARVGDGTAMVSPFHPSTSCYFNEESLRELFELVWSLNDDRLWDQGIMLRFETCPKYHSHGPGEAQKCEADQ